MSVTSGDLKKFGIPAGITKITIGIILLNQ
jgi:hypothetical protein